MQRSAIGNTDDETPVIFRKSPLAPAQSATGKAGATVKPSQ